MQTTGSGSASPNAFCESDYLNFISRQSSALWREELVSDGGVELDLHPVLTVEHLLQPLITHRFPNELVEELDTLLFSLLIGYSSADDNVQDDVKIVYVASLYLHCHATAARTSAGVADLACALIVHRARRFAREARLLMVRFLFWILEKQQSKSDYQMDYPKASLMLGAYLLCPDRTEAMLEKANLEFRTELASVGVPLDKSSIKTALEEATGFDSQTVLEQIGNATTSHETSVQLFRSVLREAKLDASKVEMLNLGDRGNTDVSRNQ